MKRAIKRRDEFMFNVDNAFWALVSKMTDCIIVALLWLLCSLPIVTLGASTTAAYYVFIKMARKEPVYIVKMFFKSLKDNFLQATIIWVVIVLLTAIGVFDIFYWHELVDTNAIAVWCLGLFIALLFFLFLVFLYIFPLLSKFDNKSFALFKFAFAMSIRHFGHTLLIIGMFALTAVATFFAAPIFFIFIAAYQAFSAKIFNHAFNKYIKVEEKEEEEEYYLDQLERELEATKPPKEKKGFFSK